LHYPVAGDWLIGRKETYKGYEDSDISKGELKKWKAEQAKAIKAFEEEQRAEQEGVAKELAEKFNGLSVSGENDYLKRKGVEAHGVRFSGGSIVVPASQPLASIGHYQQR
jgi:putative DNA primase/helicase